MAKSPGEEGTGREESVSQMLMRFGGGAAGIGLERGASGGGGGSGSSDQSDPGVELDLLDVGNFSPALFL